MRKFLLFLSVASFGLSVDAQQAYRDNKFERSIERSPVIQPTNTSVLRPTYNRQRSGGGRSVSVLNSQRIGSAGNLLSVIPSSNIAQYAFDVSKDRGQTWTSDIGSITDDPAIDNFSVSGRFPQAVIYNPEGNTNVDSAYLIYNGTWHNATPAGTTGSWQGPMLGRGQLSGDLSSFNVNWSQFNGGQTYIATSFTQSKPGVFWNINQDFTGTFVSGSPQIVQGIIIQKGVWNTTTQDVDWTDTIIPQEFAIVNNSGTNASIATSFQIAFDPSGQYGWIACLGDVELDDDVYEPIFWRSVDSGDTWDGPFQVDLDVVAGVPESLSPVLLDGSTPTSLNPTTAFDADLTVDVNGNPHLLVVIGNGQNYSIQTAGYGVWDITYDSSLSTGYEWKGKLLDQIYTLRGTFDNESPAQTSDNRPLVSRSPDGHKIFFFWSATDYEFTQSADNDIPNLFGRAIDVVDTTITPVYNFSEGDTLWGGETQNAPGGVFGGAIFPTISPTALVNGSTYNVPLVLTQVDYINFVQGQLGSSSEPAAFWYISNIDFSATAFTPDTGTTSTPVGVKEVDLVQVSMFPNPSNGRVSLLVEKNSDEFTVSAYNAIGETILAPVTYKAGTNRVEMDFSNVSGGIYFIKLQNKQGIVVKHLTIAH